MKCFQNILGKGVIAFSRQFLISPQYFQIMCIMLWHECKYQSCRRLLSQNIFVLCYDMNVSIRAAEDYSVKIYLYFSNTAFLSKYFRQYRF